MAENDKKTAEFYKPKKSIELSNVFDSDAIINPGTVMIISVDTSFTDEAVVLVFLLVPAFWAKRQFQTHQRLRRNLFWVFSQKKNEKNHCQKIIQNLGNKRNVKFILNERRKLG